MQGLTDQQVQQRVQKGLTNKTTASVGRTEWQIILGNCLSFFNLVFVVLAVLMLLVGSSPLNLTFMVVVVVNTVIGCVQEIRAKRAVDKLTLVAAQTVNTLRNGTFTPVRSDLLVQDDVVEFAAGDQICADGTVLSGNLQVNEAFITGEADPVQKSEKDILRSGSFVVSGKALVRLTQVGDAGFAARLAADAKADPRAAKSEMMRSLDRLVAIIGVILIPVGLLLFWSQMRLEGSTLRTAMEGTVAALVGMIPEGLYLLTSVALAVSAIQLTRKRVLVQDMNCIEALARVDTLCVDKTGTITQPGMELKKVVPLTDIAPEPILGALYGCGQPDNETAHAIASAFPNSGDWNCTRYIPFTSEKKWIAGEFPGHGIFLAGAPEILMGQRYDQLQETVEQHAAGGQRVLLLAEYDGQLDENPDYKQVRPLALVLLQNRLRTQAKETFAYFAQQGVQVKVISGDNPVTVSRVAEQTGIADARQYVDTQILETDEDFSEAVHKYTVFGRVTPDKKKRLIRALQKRKHTVAMTGDGVNDVLAMKQSDCGVAMASGAQAASQVARLVLLDSDFSAMPQIVGEGRRVINNIQRAATLFLVKNIFSLGTALITLFTGLRFPLESFHLSIVAALTIGVPGFFLAMEPNYARVSGRFMATTLRRAFPAGLTNIGMVLLAQAVGARLALPNGDMQTVCTAVLLTVGLLMLYRVCIPFTTLRKILCIAMTVAVVGAFFVLPPVVGYLTITSTTTWFVLAGAVALTPLVFGLMQLLFYWGDVVYQKIKK